MKSCSIFQRRAEIFKLSGKIEHGVKNDRNVRRLKFRPHTPCLRSANNDHAQPIGILEADQMPDVIGAVLIDTIRWLGPVDQRA